MMRTSTKSWFVLFGFVGLTCFNVNSSFGLTGTVVYTEYTLMDFDCQFTISYNNEGQPIEKIQLVRIETAGEKIVKEWYDSENPSTRDSGLQKDSEYRYELRKINRISGAVAGVYSFSAKTGAIAGQPRFDLIWQNETYKLTGEVRLKNNVTLSVQSTAKIDRGEQYSTYSIVLDTGSLEIDGAEFLRGTKINSITISGAKPVSVTTNSLILKNCLFSCPVQVLGYFSTLNLENNTALQYDPQSTTLSVWRSVAGLWELVGAKPEWRISGNQWQYVSLKISANESQNIAIEKNTLDSIFVTPTPEFGGPKLNGLIAIEDNKIDGYLVNTQYKIGDIYVRGLGKSGLKIRRNTGYARIRLFDFDPAPDAGRYVSENKDAFQLLFDNVDNVNAQYNTFRGSVDQGYSIWLKNGENNSISNNQIEEMKVDGLYYHFGGDLPNVGLMVGPQGYDKYETADVVSNNKVIGNIVKGYKFGIGLSGTKNILSENNVTGCWVALRLGSTHSSQNAKPTENQVFNNWFESSCRIDNYNYPLRSFDIAKNYERYCDVPNSCTNTWYSGPENGPNILNGPSIGGNFWSDYGGIDKNGDGFGDTPFILDGDNVDPYPLTVNSLQLNKSQFNSDNKAVSVPSDDVSEMDFLHFTLTLSPQATQNSQVGRITFQYIGNVDPTIRISYARLYWDSDGNGMGGKDYFEDSVQIAKSGNWEPLSDSDSNITMQNVSPLSSEPVAYFTLNFHEHPIKPGETVHLFVSYILNSGVQPCEMFGARICRLDIPTTIVNTNQPVAVYGGAVEGSFTNKGCYLVTSVEPEGAGFLRVNPSKTCYVPGESIEFIATENHGYRFHHYTGLDAGKSNPCKTTVNWSPGETKYVIAHFKEKDAPDDESHGKTKDPIDTSTGEFYFNLPLFDLGGPIPVVFDLYYGSHASSVKDVDRAFGQVMGPNWLHTYQIMRLYKGDTRTKIIYDRGNVLTFESDGVHWKSSYDEKVPYELKTDDMGNFYLLDPSKKLVYRFNANRRLDRIEDRNGNALQLTYDNNGNLTQVGDGLGRMLNFTYEGSRLMGVSDSNNRAYQFSYNTSGYLASIADPMGYTTRYEYTDRSDRLALMEWIYYPKGNYHTRQYYDNWGRVVIQKDAYNNSTEMSYNRPSGAVYMEETESTTISDPLGNNTEHRHQNKLVLTEAKDAAGNPCRMKYDDNLRRTQVTDRLGDSTQVSYHSLSGEISDVTNTQGGVTHYTYTPRSQKFGTVEFTFYDLTRIDHPDGTNEQFTCDERGNTLIRHNKMGNRWQYTYNAKGQVLSETNPAGGVTSYTYLDDGNVSESNDSELGTAQYKYDRFKRLIQTTYPDGSSSKSDFNEMDWITGLTDEKGRISTYDYDNNGNRITEIDPSGARKEYRYDLMDREIEMTDREGNTTSTAYDKLGRLASIQDPNGRTTQYGRDRRGWINQVSRGSTVSRAGYDEEGVTNSSSTASGLTSTYSSNSAGFITGVTDPLGHSVSVKWDSMNRMTDATDAMGRTTRFTYDKEGQKISITDPSGNSVYYERNELGLVTKIKDLNGEEWLSQYSPMGRLLSQTDPLGNTWNYSYDSRDRLAQIAYPDGRALAHTYDKVGNLIEKKFSGGLSMSYQYDVMDRLTSTEGIAFQYSKEGQITETRQGDIRFGSEYLNNGQLKSVSYNNGQFAVTYQYDESTGLLTQVDDTLTGTRIHFIYDADGHLIGIQRSNSLNTAIAWDPVGRITQIHDGEAIDFQYSLNDVGEVVKTEGVAPYDLENRIMPSEETYSFDHASQIVADGFQYDRQGRQTAKPGNQYVWDDSSRLIQFNDTQLTYSGLDDLLSRKKGDRTTGYYYNYGIALTPIVAERDETSGKFSRFYVWTPGGELLYMIDAARENQVYFYHFDRMGSTVALSDKNGIVADTYAYDPYGLLLDHQGENAQPFTFIGQFGVRQEDAGGTLYHMRARFYDAAMGRFLSRDPIWPDLDSPSQLDPYQYALQNPMLYKDPEGTIVEILEAAQCLSELTNLPFLNNVSTVNLRECHSKYFKKFSWWKGSKWYAGKAEWLSYLSGTGYFPKYVTPFVLKYFLGIQAQATKTGLIFSPATGYLASAKTVFSSGLKAVGPYAKAAGVIGTLISGGISWAEVVDRGLLTSPAENSKMVGEESHSQELSTKVISHAGRFYGDFLFYLEDYASRNPDKREACKKIQPYFDFFTKGPLYSLYNIAKKRY